MENIEKKLCEMHAQMCNVFTSPKRLEILNLLRSGEKSVGEIEEATGISQSNISQHLAILREKMIVQTRREGTSIFYSLADKRILKAFDIIREMLYDRIRESANLSKHLDKQ